jgi:hypothetical protein
VRLTADALRAAAERAYPEHDIKTIREPRRPDRPVSIGLEKDGLASERLFDPYAGTDMGHAYPPTLRFVEWLVDLHDNLLAGTTGRFVNGLAGLLVTLLFGIESHDVTTSAEAKSGPTGPLGATLPPTPTGPVRAPSRGPERAVYSPPQPAVYFAFPSPSNGCRLLRSDLRIPFGP